MPRYTAMLANGMKKRGHPVEVFTPESRMYNFSSSKNIKKWLGYIDQYILFPRQVQQQLQQHPNDTLYIFTDHALGPWVPLVAHRPHVIHCHDFLAQKSAEGLIADHRLAWTGRMYQKYIRGGYCKGKNFISVSQKTREDLHTFLYNEPSSSDVVYNGLNKVFSPQDPSEARRLLSQKIGRNMTQGYLLHVGGNQWYKNRLGVVEIYDAWRSGGKQPLKLLMIGEKPNKDLYHKATQSPYYSDIAFVDNLSDEYVRSAYAGASVFLFPSLAEGFGWPIAEAMACGCLVITTNEAPMTEVAGEAGFFIPRRPQCVEGIKNWALGAALMIDEVLWLSSMERRKVMDTSLVNAERFDRELALDKIEKIYQTILLGRSESAVSLKRVLQ